MPVVDSAEQHIIVAIAGAGGLGREVLDIVDALAHHGVPIRCRGFLDDGPVRADLLAARSVGVIGGTDTAMEPGRYVIAVGDGATRRQIDERLSATGWSAVSLQHPESSIGFGCSLGEGTVMAAGARVTSNVMLGRHCQLHVNVTVGHDVVMGDFVTVLPGATVSGNVQLGHSVTVGTGANILPGLTVGAGAYVGAGAVVTHDVEPGTTVVGVPARPLERD